MVRYLLRRRVLSVCALAIALLVVATVISTDATVSKNAVLGAQSAASPVNWRAVGLPSTWKLPSWSQARNSTALGQVALTTGWHASLRRLMRAEPGDEARPPDQHRPMRLLIGVFSTIGNLQQREVIRMGYERFLIRHGERYLDSDDLVDIRFVVGRPKSVVEQTLLLWEQEMYGDMIALDVEENIDEGKTFEFFHRVAERVSFIPFESLVAYDVPDDAEWMAEVRAMRAIPLVPCDGDAEAWYDFVLKIDDDSYVHLGNLFRELRGLLHEPYVYWGRDCSSIELPTDVRAWRYACGLGYGMSSDLVEWLGNSEIPARDVDPNRPWEDAVIGHWLLLGNKTSNLHLRHDRLFNFDPFESRAKQGGKFDLLRPDSIIVHNLKRPPIWIDVAKWYDSLEVTGMPLPQPYTKVETDLRPLAH